MVESKSLILQTEENQIEAVNNLSSEETVLLLILLTITLTKEKEMQQTGRWFKEIHFGEKLYQCNLCDYASVHAGNFRTHLKTHSGEKSYECDFASVQSGNLRRHYKTEDALAKYEPIYNNAIISEA